MQQRPVSGAEALCATLEQLGVDHVFSLPGTQTVGLFDALRRSRLRTVVATHELAASFMANGYYRASGRPGVLITIPGPGFTYALTGVAEAFLDSAALLHITLAPSDSPGREFQLQALDQVALAEPVTKAIYEVQDAEALSAITATSYRKTREGEPGPVLLQIAPAALREETTSPAIVRAEAPEPPPPSPTEQAIALVRRSRRPVLFVGQGAADAPAQVKALAERLRAPVVSTTSGRGILAEDHALSLGFELGGTDPRALNELTAASDLVLAVGCKFSHNGSRGFGLRLRKESLIQVDVSERVLAANYPARLAIQSDAGQFLDTLLKRGAVQDRADKAWPDERLAELRCGSGRSWSSAPEPRIGGSTPAAFFAGLRSTLPREACLVTDSGLHQMLVRKHFRVLAPRGLVVPSNLQSMGFAVPAAIGAKLAQPDRVVVAVLGDGGAIMSSLELLTAVKEKLQLGVLVCNDGFYGLIRRSQMASYGTAPGSRLLNPDFSLLAGATGTSYMTVGSDLEQDLENALRMPGVTLFEARVGESAATRTANAKSRGRRLVPSSVRAAIKRALGRR